MTKNIKPRIGLNGRFLIAKKTGVQRSALHLFTSIINHTNEFDFYLFAHENQLNNPLWQKNNVTIISCNLKENAYIQNYLWEQIELPRLIKKYKIDLLHNPANMAPVFCKAKTIVNIHDVCFLIEPKWFSKSFSYMYNFLMPIVAKKSTIVVTNSNNSKNDIMEYLHVPVDKIRKVYWAVDPIFSDYNIPYKNRENRILYVGSLEPRKNLSGLLAAYDLFREQNKNLNHKLSIVGCENKVFATNKIKPSKYIKDIEFIGYLNDIELAKLYANSRLLVYPSFYEGFGFPPLEAMHAGTPVITSNNSSLIEITEGAAILINPSDITSIANKIEEILCNDKLANQLIIAGYEKVKLFSWENVAEHMISIYKEILQQD